MYHYGGVDTNTILGMLMICLDMDTFYFEIWTGFMFRQVVENREMIPGMLGLIKARVSDIYIRLGGL